MNDPAQIEPAAENALAVLDRVDADPKLILLGKVDQEAYMAQLRASVLIVTDDISTAAARDRVKSAAQSIRTRKAAIDRTRKGLTEHWRNQTAAVNEAGKVVIADLDALIDEVRAPVTAWEQAEAKRVDEANGILADLEGAKMIAFGMTSEIVEGRLGRIRGINLNPDILGVRIEMATDLRDEAVKVLTEALAGLKAQEAQAAELAQLRADQERQRIAAEQAEQERTAKERADVAAKAEAERIERAKAEAAVQARHDAEHQALLAQEERDRAAQAEIDAANARAAEAERLAQVERDQAAHKEAVRRQAEEAEQAQKRKREADIAHRQQVIEAAAEALTGIPLVTQKMARAIINEIASGNVPAVRIEF